MQDPQSPSSLDRTLSIVIPVYFNEASLPNVFAALREFEPALAEEKMLLEIVFIDDGSGDGSFNRLLAFKQERPATKVVKLSRNFGAPAAAKAALKFVTGDCFVFIPADLQEPLEEILPMLAEWRAGHKFVISARVSRGDPLMTRFLASIYYVIVKWMVTSNYPKGGIGLMLMDNSLLSLLFNSPKNSNPNMYAFWLGFDPKILPYHRRNPVHGKSGWTFRKKLKLFVDTITGFSIMPLRIISLLGCIVASMSFAYALWIFAAGLIQGVAPSGFITIVVLISFLGGCNLLILGMIAEYMWRIADNQSGRPEVVIAETHL